MNGRHWSDYSEQELGRMRAGTCVGGARQPQALVPADVTAQTRAVLVPAMAAAEPAYPAEWLPEVQAVPRHHGSDASGLDA